MSCVITTKKKLTGKVCSEITIIKLHVCLVMTHLVNLHFIDIN